MQKELYILRGLPDEDYKQFKSRILELTQTVLNEFVPETLKVCLTLKTPPVISVIPFMKKKVALISIKREKDAVLKMITEADGFVGGYSGEEHIPVGYIKDWKDGEPTPGECLLTLFHKKPGIDRETFLKRWHEGDTPLSLKLHPLWNYNRNVVKSSLTEDSLWYDGIVEEQFKKSSELLNPFIFFGPPHKVPIHMYQVLMDTKAFIDMKRIEPYLATEIHLKS